MLAAPRKIPSRDGLTFVVPVKAGVAIFQSALVILAAGAARPGRAGQGADDAAKATDAATYRAVGVALQSVTGGVADGDVTVEVKAGKWAFKNSAGGDAITEADIGRTCYVVDDETVAKTHASGTRCPAGTIFDLDADGVWVDVGPQNPELGVRKLYLPFAISETDTLAGTSAELVSPVAGNITQLDVIVQKAITTGGPVTVNVGATPVAGLSAVIPDAAAKGTVVTDVPTPQDATRAVAAGQRIQIVPDAAFATAGAISGVVEITY